jgi:hypothetical protein
MRSVLAVAAICAATGGCLDSQPLGADGIAPYFQLHTDPWKEATREPLIVSGQQVPTRWVFRQSDSLLWSTVSIVREIDRLEEGVDTFDVAISNAHAEMIDIVLRDMRDALGELRVIGDPGTATVPARWADAVAGALVSIEKVSRAAGGEGGRETDPNAEGVQRRGDPRAWAAGPIIELITTYTNQQTGGSLLAGMGSTEFGRLREALVQVTLRMGFAAAGKQPPRGLRPELAQQMQAAEEPDQLEVQLEEQLLAALDAAPPAERGDPLPGVLQTTFQTMDTALRVIQGGVRQWDRVRSVTIELRERGDDTIVSIIPRVQPGREVKLVQLVPFQPILAFRGESRITVLPETKPGGQVVVLFEHGDDGRTELRFEGIIYPLVRLFALPLADASLREIRVLTAQDDGHDLTQVEIFMQALSDSSPRLMAVQMANSRLVERSAFEVKTIHPMSRTLFNYLTPTRRYTYEHQGDPVSESP